MLNLLQNSEGVWIFAVNLVDLLTFEMAVIKNWLGHAIYNMWGFRYTVDRQWLGHWWLISHGCFKLILEPLGKNHIAANLGWFSVIFFSFFILKMAYCVYSLDSPQWGNSNENTQHTFMKIKKNIPRMPPDLALWLTLISSNYPCFEHIFMVPKVFEPLKLYYTCEVKQPDQSLHSFALPNNVIRQFMLLMPFSLPYDHISEDDVLLTSSLIISTSKDCLSCHSYSNKGCLFSCRSLAPNVKKLG